MTTGVPAAEEQAEPSEGTTDHHLPAADRANVALQDRVAGGDDVTARRHHHRVEFQPPTVSRRVRYVTGSATAIAGTAHIMAPSVDQLLNLRITPCAPLNWAREFGSLLVIGAQLTVPDSCELNLPRGSRSVPTRSEFVAR